MVRGIYVRKAFDPIVEVQIPGKPFMYSLTDEHALSTTFRVYKAFDISIDVKIPLIS